MFLIISYHVIWYSVLSYDKVLDDTTFIIQYFNKKKPKLYHIMIQYRFIFYNTLLNDTVSYDIVSCNKISCPTTWYNIISFITISYNAKQYHIIKYHIIFYHIVLFHLLLYNFKQIILGKINRQYLINQRKVVRVV